MLPIHYLSQITITPIFLLLSTAQPRTFQLHCPPSPVSSSSLFVPSFTTQRNRALGRGDSIPSFQSNSLSLRHLILAFSYTFVPLSSFFVYIRLLVALLRPCTHPSRPPPWWSNVIHSLLSGSKEFMHFVEQGRLIITLRSRHLSIYMALIACSLSSYIERLARTVLTIHLSCAFQCIAVDLLSGTSNRLLQHPDS